MQTTTEGIHGKNYWTYGISTFVLKMFKKYTVEVYFSVLKIIWKWLRLTITPQTHFINVLQVRVENRDRKENTQPWKFKCAISNDTCITSNYVSQINISVFILQSNTKMVFQGQSLPSCTTCWVVCIFPQMFISCTGCHATCCQSPLPTACDSSGQSGLIMLFC